MRKIETSSMSQIVYKPLKKVKVSNSWISRKFQ